MELWLGMGCLVLALLAAGLFWRGERWRHRVLDGLARQNALLEALGLGLCVRDELGHVQAVTPVFRQILGFPVTDDCEGWLAILPEEDRQALLQAWANVPGVLNSRVIRLPDSGGEMRWGRFCYAPLSGRRWVITVEDVSEHRLAEESRRESEQRFAQMFYLLPATATITNVETGCFVDVNHMWEPMFGYTREETIGHTSTELDAWGCIEDRKTVLSTILRDGVIRDYSFRARRKDKTLFDCILSGRLIDFAAKRYLLLIIRDVTEELRVSRALQESERKFATIFQESLAALLLSRPETSVILDVNRAWLDMMCRSREETIGHSAQELGLWASPEEREDIVARVTRDGQADRVECHFRRGNGVVRLCLVSCRRLTLNGEDYLLWGTQDITEQRALEQEIQAMNSTLEARVHERTAALEQANCELQQANEKQRRTQTELVRAEKLAALGKLVAGVAHELNTPIGNGVTAASSLQWQANEFRRDMAEVPLKRSVLEDFVDYVATGSELILRNLKQAYELVISFKQVAVDRTCDLRRRFELQDFVDELLQTHHSEIYHCGCEIKVVVALAPKIVFDSFPGALGQVIGNLIENALLHAFEGREHGAIAIRAQLCGTDRVELRFEDDGVGIEAGSLGRIFDPFYTTKFGRGGNGLGLHIAYNTVTNVLGGEINVSSEPGRGTCFVLDLPLSAPTVELAC